MIDFILVFSVWTLIAVAFINVAFNSDAISRDDKPIRNNIYINFTYSISCILICAYAIFIDLNLKWYYYFLTLLIIYLILAIVGGFLFSINKKIYVNLGGLFVPKELRYILNDNGIYSRIMFFVGLIGIIITLIW